MKSGRPLLFRSLAAVDSPQAIWQDPAAARGGPGALGTLTPANVTPSVSKSLASDSCLEPEKTST